MPPSIKASRCPGAGFGQSGCETDSTLAVTVSIRWSSTKCNRVETPISTPATVPQASVPLEEQQRFEAAPLHDIRCRFVGSAAPKGLDSKQRQGLMYGTVPGHWHALISTNYLLAISQVTQRVATAPGLCRGLWGV